MSDVDPDDYVITESGDLVFGAGAVPNRGNLEVNYSYAAPADYEEELVRAEHLFGRSGMVDLLDWAEDASGRLLSDMERALFLKGMCDDRQRQADRQSPTTIEVWAD